LGTHIPDEVGAGPEFYVFQSEGAGSSSVGGWCEDDFTWSVEEEISDGSEVGSMCVSGVLSSDVEGLEDSKAAGECSAGSRVSLME